MHMYDVVNPGKKGTVILSHYRSGGTQLVNTISNVIESEENSGKGRLKKGYTLNFVGEVAEGHGGINTCVYLHSPTNSGLIQKRADGVTTETHFHVLDEDLQYKANILNAMLSGSTLEKEGKTETMFIDDVGFAVRKKTSRDNCVKERISIQDKTAREFVSAEYETFYYLVQK